MRFWTCWTSAAGGTVVRPPAGGPAREWRTRWVSASTIEGMGRSGVTQQPAPAADVPNRQRVARGSSLASARGRVAPRARLHVFNRFGRLISSGGGTNNFAVVTNFLVGWAPTDRVLLFYSNKATSRRTRATTRSA